MRLWIGPDGERIDLDETDMSHSLAVARDPARYGLAPDPIERHLADFEAGENDLDYETLIAMAEMKGWVRVSRDADFGSLLAVSASDERTARRALAALFDGLVPALLLEIERIEDGKLKRSFRDLDEDAALAFVVKGRLPPKREHVTEVDTPELLEALRSPALAL